MSIEISTPVSGKSNYGPGEVPLWDDYSKCIHCGLCLNSCPTYRVLGQEMDSPRGRIYQMIQVDRGRLELGESFVRHIGLCLDCRACETACPSGVEYGRLVEAARGQIERYSHRSAFNNLLRNLFFRSLLPHPGRLRAVGWLLRAYQRSGAEKAVQASGLLKILPGHLDQVSRLSPRMEKPFFFNRMGKVVPAIGPCRYRVALIAGCIAQVAFARLNDATVRVLARNGCEVTIPAEQGCCGALHVHSGFRDMAREMALKNIRAFEAGKYDAIVTNAAGCGSVLKEYPELFEHEQRKHLRAAKSFSAGVKDVTEFLAEIGVNHEMKPVDERVTYQDPCHLGHAQRIRSAPRELIASVPGLEFVELKEAEVCCGSAGIYNVVHNDLSMRLLEAKMERVDETRAGLILTANPGCMIQLRAGVAASANPHRRVLHVVELLDEAYGASTQRSE
ncbi:MAG: heterodisulfide reductase-related iron-sulfur binding cluster [Terriglobia bacterium]